MKERFVIVVLVSYLCILGNAQDLNGFWKGTLTMRGCFPENNIELQISLNNEGAIGDSYHYQDIHNYVKKKFKGSYDEESKRLSLQEGIVTTYHIPARCVICIKQFQLVYSKSGNLETLRGSWNGHVLNTGNSCEGGAIVLTRIKESAFKEIPEIKVDTGTIRLDFYDNAQVDGDSITVLVNKKVVLTHQKLSSKPITTYLKIDLLNTFYEVEMIAENLGSIPPNTAILIVTAGKKRYQLSLASSETKSAMIRFVYEPDKMVEDNATR